MPKSRSRSLHTYVLPIGNGWTLHSYGKYLIQNKKYSQAEEKIRESVTLARKYMGENHPQVPVIYCDLANAAAMQEKFEYSLECLEEGKKLARPNSVDMVWLLVNQGPVEAKRNDMRSAKTSCNKAKQIAEKLKHETLIKAAEECFNRISIWSLIVFTAKWILVGFAINQFKLWLLSNIWRDIEGSEVQKMLRYIDSGSEKLTMIFQISVHTNKRHNW